MLRLLRHSLLLQAYPLWSLRTELSRGALERGLLFSTLGLTLVGGARGTLGLLTGRLPVAHRAPNCRCAGQFSDAAGAAGCTVIMLEPLLSNVAHLWQTIEKNGWQEQVRREDLA